MNINDTDLPIKKMIAERLIPIANAFLTKRINIFPRSAPFSFVSKTSCYKAEIPITRRVRPLEGDLLILVTYDNEPDQDFTAWAAPCNIDPISGRPFAGQLHFNLLYFKEIETFESKLDKIFHELNHILAFSTSLFGLFKDKTGKPYKAITK